DGTVQEQFGRFSLLEIVQRYALARLSESGQVQRRHAQYYLALVESSEPDLYGGAGQRTAMRLLEREQDNIRAALAFAVERGEVEVAQQFCGAFFLFWGRRA